MGASKQRLAEWTELTAATRRVAEGWYRLYQRDDLHEDWDDFQHYKANGRWATGVQRDLEALDLAGIGSRDALLDAAEHVMRTRPWDTDYEEPVDSRRQLLAVVAELRAAR